MSLLNLGAKSKQNVIDSSSVCDNLFKGYNEFLDVRSL
jgi:hypothetical protein